MYFNQIYSMMYFSIITDLLHGPGKKLHILSFYSLPHLQMSLLLLLFKNFLKWDIILGLVKKNFKSSSYLNKNSIKFYILAFAHCVFLFPLSTCVLWSGEPNFTIEFMLGIWMTEKCANVVKQWETTIRMRLSTEEMHLHLTFKTI
jgi:hypothetical protein